MTKKQFVEICKALSNNERLQILIWLKSPEKYFKNSKFDLSKEGVCVGLIQQKSSLSDSTVCQYLRQLESVGLITAVRREKWTLCKINLSGLGAFKGL